MIFLEVSSTGLLSRLLSNELMTTSLVANEANLVSRKWGARRGSNPRPSD